MRDTDNKFESYFSHLQKISLIGRIYKRFYASLILFICARCFGKKVVEVGSGTGNGILGAFPSSVHGLEINPVSVDHCKEIGLKVDLITENDIFPVSDCQFDACVLDNVLEHIENPDFTLNECYRITKKGGGLIIAVPGLRGFKSDSDHKVFYGLNHLLKLDDRWQLRYSFSLPFIVKIEMLSKFVKQYCLVAIYKKI